MRFSIIIPAYNAERYFKECLDSVKEEEFRDFEVIVIDDGSEDSTGVIAERFAEETENAVVLHGSNQGLLLARRRGLDAASSEYVIFLDADDTLRPDALRVIAAAIASSGADIVSFEMTRRPGFSVSDSSSPLAAGLYDGMRFGDVRVSVSTIICPDSQSVWDTFTTGKSPASRFRYDDRISAVVSRKVV